MLLVTIAPPPRCSTKAAKSPAPSPQPGGPRPCLGVRRHRRPADHPPEPGQQPGPALLLATNSKHPHICALLIVQCLIVHLVCKMFGELPNVCILIPHLPLVNDPLTSFGKLFGHRTAPFDTIAFSALCWTVSQGGGQASGSGYQRERWNV